MEEKVIKIEIPEGYEIDKEKSTFEKIVFKSKKASYEDVCRRLFYNKESYFCDSYGVIRKIRINKNNYKDSNNCTSEKQAKKLIAINQLMNVAKYLNGDWKPNWKDSNENKYHITLDYSSFTMSIRLTHMISEVSVYFKTKELAEQAIEILGTETIKLALSTDW